MNLNEFVSNQMQVTCLSNKELECLYGGNENMFYDAGVATGRAIVRFCRWFGEWCEENKESQLYS